MKKKKLLFVTLYLQTGGVERSLLSLLSALDYQKYDVDLLLFDHSGVLFKQLPPEVNVLPPLFDTYSIPLGQAVPILLKKKEYRLLTGKVLAGGLAKFSKGVGTGVRWNVYRHTLPKLTKYYDVAISYLDLFCNYYVIEKVNANKKIVYNHMNYIDSQKKGWPCPKLDRKCFVESDHIVSVAESSKQALVDLFPEVSGKIQIIHNTVSPDVIRPLADEPILEPFDKKTFNIVTVARLVEEKGIDLALEACHLLVQNGFSIKWYVIGKGSMELEMKQRVKALGLQNTFILLGEKDNPYPYMKQADTYVQPSKTEAHCVAVEEAMALGCKILVTDIPAFKNQIQNGKAGWRVALSAEGLANGISQIYQSKVRQGQSKDQVSYSNQKREITKFLQLIN